MIEVAGSLAVGSIFFLSLYVWSSAAAASQDLPLPSDLLATDYESCPEEFVSRIFSLDDAEFIAATQSKLLAKYFLRERKAVALLWVRQTSIRLHRILREHTALARHSANLQFQTELVIFARYLQLRILCGLLFVAIALAGPIWVRGLAFRAESLFQRFLMIRDSVVPTPEIAQLPMGDAK